MVQVGGALTVLRCLQGMWERVVSCRILLGFCFKPLSATETDTHNLSVLKQSEVQIPPPAGEERFGGSLLSRSVWASNLLTDRGSPISPAAH